MMSKTNNQQVTNRPFAVFDIDGTIFRWQLYHELFDVFLDEKIITPEIAAPVLSARTAWRERAGSYDDYEQHLVVAVKEGIVGLEETRFNAVCDTILQSKGNHIYRYTLDLLNTLKKEGYVIIAISGSHQQLVDRFAKLHNIDIAIGRNHHIEEGKLTADAIKTIGLKGEILKDTVKKHALSWDNSYAVGDSSGDTPMLSLVTNPIAFNPDTHLKSEAIKNGWPIVIERKSISYRLERNSDGLYVLA